MTDVERGLGLLSKKQLAKSPEEKVKILERLGKRAMRGTGDLDRARDCVAAIAYLNRIIGGDSE